MTINLQKNAIWAIVEVLASSLTLFFLYKIVVGSLGAESLGIWSLVLATTSLGRIADIGTSAGLGRFIAMANANKQEEKLVDYAETGILTNLALNTLIALIIWGPAYYGLSLALPPESLARGHQLLPFSLISFVLSSVANATTGSLVGQHRSDQKSMVIIAALIVQFITAVSLVPRFGLPALAWSQIFQYLLISSLGWILFLKNHYGVWTARLPTHWSRSSLKSLLGFGVKLQAVSVVSMLYEPLVKYVMSALGGLEALGYFEMAQRLVLQARQLLVMPAQPLVPSFTHLAETAKEEIAPLYYKTTVILVSLGLPILLSIALLSPLVSLFWIGRIEGLFVFFLSLLPFGWFFNLLAVPAYLMGIGTGRIRGNFWGTCLTTGGAFVFSYLLGLLMGPYGVALGTNSMLAAGSLLTLFMNCRTARIPPFPDRQAFQSTWKEGWALFKNYMSKKGDQECLTK